MLTLLTSQRLIWGLIWLGLSAVTLALLVMMLTRWGTSQPLRKCTVLSLITHLLLAIYATTVHIVAAPPGSDEQPVFRVRLDDPDRSDSTVQERQPAREIVGDIKKSRPRLFEPREPNRDVNLAPMPDAARPSRRPEPPLSARQPIVAGPDLAQPPRAAPELDPQTVDPLAQKVPAPSYHEVEPVSPAEAQPVRPADHRGMPAVDSVPPEPPSVLVKQPPAIVNQPAPQDEVAEVPVPEVSVTETAKVETSKASNDSPAPSRPVAVNDGNVVRTAPRAAAPGNIYSLRRAPNRLELAVQGGGSAATEAAVDAALLWLSRNQSDDGRWDASRFGAGRGHDAGMANRHGAGTNADTGVTGLALLAFLGAGRTHHDGAYQSAVRRGLDYLTRQQRADGSLGGEAETYAFMYCHGMALLALSEALGMTNDLELELSVRRGATYSLRAQDPVSGGWRYRPGDRGDTSQLGWQIMALKSAERAGFDVPPGVWTAADRFLNSVASGSKRGLASYRPGERTSRAMTAEALVSRQFVGLGLYNKAAAEAADFVSAELPGTGVANVYYWYYATLGLYQLQGDRWQTWNKALTAELLRTQVTDGDATGSWAPDGVWGGHGGRVYSTAMSAMCLEVYYRFLPLYLPTARLDKRVK